MAKKKQRIIKKTDVDRAKKLLSDKDLNGFVLIASIGEGDGKEDRNETRIMSKVGSDIEIIRNLMNMTDKVTMDFKSLYFRWIDEYNFAMAAESIPIKKEKQKVNYIG